MYIEYNSGDRYQKIVLAQQEYDSQVIPFKRGDIVDAKGTVLATSIDVYNVILDCKLMNANPDKMEATIARLATCFPDIDIAYVRNLISAQPKKQYTILKKKVSYDDMRKFTEVNEDDDRENDIKGVWFEKEYIRSYPYDSFAASLLGFITSGNAGMTGLENEYNSVLNGTNGRSYGYLNEDSDIERTVIEPSNGNTLVTTLDINVQTIIEEEIAEFNRAYAHDGMPGARNIAVLAMNPQTGEILAMANFPTFNLNDPWNLAATGMYTEEQVDEMTSEEQLDALNRIWQNFCITTTYEPGSVFKPFTIATGLETGTMSGNETYYCDGSEHIANFDIHCVKREGHGMLDVKMALAHSCNDCLMQMSYVIGAKNFADYQALFGFGQRTGVDLPGEAMTFSLIYSEEELENTVNIATNSFGQNFNTTMIQMAAAFASLINGGNLYQPYLMSHALDEAGNVVVKREPVLLKKTLSKEISEQMKEYLRAVVTEGSGNIGGVSGYDIGGKTGTAQKLPRS
ncbi:MAG: penicillin-binding protein 2, partial [Lachnospiraceae bacterium]|nr:penicillin-binding protein 2 [Lachnospiraceae bacterium]